MFHGRNAPDESLDNWGFDGPTLEGVAAVHSTYGNQRVFFDSPESLKAAQLLTGWDDFHCGESLDMPIHEDLLVISLPDGRKQYFGDWKIQSETQKDEKLVAKTGLILTHRRQLIAPSDCLSQLR
jgi:hypothetical protein